MLTWVWPWPWESRFHEPRYLRSGQPGPYGRWYLGAF